MNENIHINIEDMKVGDTIRSFYLVKQKQIKKTRAGKDYLALVLQDNTGNANGKVWDDADTFTDMFSAGDIVKIEADAGEYQNNIDLNIRRIRMPLEQENIDYMDFMPVSPLDPDEMEKELRSIVETVTNPFLAALVTTFLNDREFMQMFRRGVASKTIHHSYLGGLMEHTLSVCKITDFLSSHYPGTDRDILLTGAFLHDIGKLRELNSGPETGYTDEGTLIGHMVLGAQMVRDRIRELPEFPEDLETEIIHTVLSHQGEYEWGSPVLPMTREALIIHFVDNMDAKQFIALKAAEECREDGNFTQKVYPLNRTIYKRKDSSE